jgi:anti-sigma B factor antagonist
MFSVDLRTRESGGHVVVELRGELDLADAAGVATALAAVAAREPQIIVDLAALEFIDSSGVAALARGRRQARRAGGDLLLAAPAPRVLRILTTTRLIDAFSVHDSVEEAARAIRSPPTAAGPTPRRRINRLRPVRTVKRSASRPAEGGPSPGPPQARQLGA